MGGSGGGGTSLVQMLIGMLDAWAKMRPKKIFFNLEKMGQRHSTKIKVKTTQILRKWGSKMLSWCKKGGSKRSSQTRKGWGQNR